MSLYMDKHKSIDLGALNINLQNTYNNKYVWFTSKAKKKLKNMISICFFREIFTSKQISPVSLFLLYIKDPKEHSMNIL